MKGPINGKIDTTPIMMRVMYWDALLAKGMVVFEGFIFEISWGRVPLVQG